MAGRLAGKVAVITGGTSGIGEATARCFIAEGAQVVIAGRSQERGAALANQLGERAIFCRADVMHEAEIAAAIDAAVKRFGKLDCLFNNAGASTPGEIDSITEEQFDFGMKLLVGSVLFGIKHAARAMQASGGSIINNSSIAAHRLGQGGTLYSAAKAAVSHITRIAGAKLGAQGIRVNAISPGAIATPIFWGGSTKAQTLSADEPESSQNSRVIWRVQRPCHALALRTILLSPPYSWQAMKAASSIRMIWWSTVAASRSSTSGHHLKSARPASAHPCSPSCSSPTVVKSRFASPVLPLSSIYPASRSTHRMTQPPCTAKQRMRR